MHQFTRGQKGRLADLGCPHAFMVEIDLASHGYTVDFACFGLDAQARLSDDRYMVFYNQLASPGEAVRLEPGGARTRFSVNLDLLPPAICRLVFAATVDGAAVMRDLGTGTLTLGSCVRFAFGGADFTDEKAVIVAELYRHDGQWRFGAVGQGFRGGLSALLAHYGGQEARPATPAPAPPTPPVSLSKITLDKRGDKVSLTKRTGHGYGRIHVNLNWSQGAPVATPPPPARGGLLGRLAGLAGTPRARSARGIDLDLGCMYELADGRRGVVQALGNTFGSYAHAPFIELDADDRTGASQGGENLYINGERIDQIRRAVIYAFIYEGVPNWQATNGVVTIEAPGQAPIEVRLDGGERQIMCAIALIENRNGQLVISKVDEYFQQLGSTSAHELLDRHFGFGMRWKTGTK